MSEIWSIVAWFLVVAGLLGTLLPLIPGGPLILAGAAVYYVSHPDGPLSLLTLCGLIVLAVVGFVIDWVSTFVSAKWFGAAKLSIWLGVIGGIVGIFFGPLGILVGPLIGVLGGELISGKKAKEAMKSTIGTLLGAGGGFVMKALVSLAMVVWFAWDVWS